MKPFSLICVILVLVLNFVPCADAQETVDQHSSFSSQQSEKEHAHPAVDSCTPFCHCSCCASSSVVQLFYLNIILLPEYPGEPIPYFSRNYVDISLPIWQPPQWL